MSDPKKQENPTEPTADPPTTEEKPNPQKRVFLNSLKETLEREIIQFSQTLQFQVAILSKMNGLFSQELWLVPPHRGECLDSNLSDSWMAKHMMGKLEVLHQDGTYDHALLQQIQFGGKFSCIRFDCEDRLWICNEEGCVEILDVARSQKKLAIVRYTLFRLDSKIDHSRLD